VHDLYDARAAAALGRGHRRAEDGAGERIRHITAVRDGERLGRVLRVRVGVAVIAAVRVVGVRVGMGVVLRGRGRVHVAALVAAREVVRGVVVLLRCGGMGCVRGRRGRAAARGGDWRGGDGGTVEGGG
jgi:hypothetical protein